jgi:IS1 family transposase
MVFRQKKEARLTPVEKLQGLYGDCWTYIAFDPRHKVVVAHVVGRRTGQNTRRLLEKLRERSGERAQLWLTSDEFTQYETALLSVYGITTPPPPRPPGQRGRPPGPRRQLPPHLLYTQVVRHRRQGRVVKVETRLVHGEPAQLAQQLAHGGCSRQVNLAFVERNNLTLRLQDSKLRRRSPTFAKQVQTFCHHLEWTLAFYHLCRLHRGLKQPAMAPHRRWQLLTPFMSASLTDHPWTIRELLSYRIPMNHTMGGH